MSVEILTPETLTWENISQWTGATMRKYMQNPPMRAAIQRIVAEQQVADVMALQTRLDEEAPAPEAPPAALSSEELILQAAQELATRQAAETKAVEDGRLAAEAEAAKNKKFVLDYQATDENGEPIGRPTHLEATSNEELIEKIKKAHIEATRAFHRLKKQKVQTLREANSQPVPEVPQQYTDAELLTAVKDLRSDDPNVVLSAHKRLNKVEIDKAQAEADRKVAEANELRRQEAVSFAFLKNHQTDFNNCEANVNLIKTYFEDNQLAWTLDNLEIAFHALETELAPVVVLAAPPPPANPAPQIAPVVPTPTAVPPVQAIPTVPAPVVPPVNPAPALPRPAFNGSIIPGSTSAPRPASRPTGGLTMEEINSWDGPTMRAKMRIPQQRAEIERVIASVQALKRK